MDCPVCRHAMVTLELNEVEIDNCVACGGIWLDAGELETLIEDAQKATSLLASFQVSKDTREKPRRCPICDKKMHKILVPSSDHPLLIDRCRRNHGLWFDQGELDDILAHAQLDKDNKIRQLLADMFGRHPETPSEDHSL
jgi:Zn-finger nucleic acid-binding protein